MYIERVIISNRAPVENLDLSLEDKTINILTAINGRGKTTILSYIMDAWVEFTRGVYNNSYKGRETSYYRVSSVLYTLDNSQPSLVYIRFVDNETNLDYLDIRGNITSEQYNSIVSMDSKIDIGKIKNDIDKQGGSAKLITQLDNKKIRSIFEGSIHTYFPEYRYELPNYLNEVYAAEIKYDVDQKYNGYLNTPLEVTSNIHDVANWLLDVILDRKINEEIFTTADGRKVDKTPETNLWTNIRIVLQNALSGKYADKIVRLGIGRRTNTGSRISVMEAVQGGNDVLLCPSIFNLSSGELTILSIFCELLKQGDVIFNEKPMSAFNGIVLIDEVDKNLHIKLLKEILPQLFKLFPNLQFIVSSHSPFLNMGLAEVEKERTKIIDLDNGGIVSSPETTQLYNEVYEMMLGEKNLYAKAYTMLKEQIASSTKPLIITEGKTDVDHLKAALKRLNRQDIDVDFAILPEQKWGDAELKKYLENISKIPSPRRIIAMFDRDVSDIVKKFEPQDASYLNMGNNVYAFCIPIPQGREAYNKISIEFYYTDGDILKKNNGKRLFFNNEIDVLYNKSRNSNEYKELDRPDKDREFDKQILDEKDMCTINEHIHSKKTFAKLMLEDDVFSHNVDFSQFNKIFDRIRDIINM